MPNRAEICSVPVAIPRLIAGVETLSSATSVGPRRRDGPHRVVLGEVDYQLGVGDIASCVSGIARSKSSIDPIIDRVDRRNVR